MSKIRLDVHFYFASFHIRLKLITTEYKMLLKCLILIRCTTLLCFLLIFLILLSDQSDLSMFLYIFIVFAMLNNYHEIVFFSFFIQETVFFMRLSVNCKKQTAYCSTSVEKFRCFEIQSMSLIFLTVSVSVFFHDLCLTVFLILTLK